MAPKNNMNPVLLGALKVRAQGKAEPLTAAKINLVRSSFFAAPTVLRLSGAWPQAPKAPRSDSVRRPL
jgi:hypothetical protein